MPNLMVMDTAIAEAGYLEKASNKQLDDKTANAGAGNYTKYARDLDALGNFYNGKKQGAPWCDVFVDWCFVTTYGAETAKKMLYQPDKSLGAGVNYSAQYYKAAGRYFDTPQRGDQIFFGEKGKYTHTGLVVAVGDSYVYTIEGNTSGASGVIANGGGVCRKSYRLNYANIYGYGRPNYDLVKEDEVTVTLSVLKKGDKGPLVKTAQALLIKKHGVSCGIYGADGDYGNSTVKAVQNFQKKKGIPVDGVIGQKTWEALLF